jgi:hypothetical protein
MESLPGEEGFKHLPVRMFKGSDGAMLGQRLFKTVDTGEAGSKHKRTMKDLLREAFPDREPEEGEREGERKKQAGQIA